MAEVTRPSNGETHPWAAAIMLWAAVIGSGIVLYLIYDAFHQEWPFK